MNDFTREQLEDFQAVAYNHPLDGYRNTVQDLADFALALLDRAEKAEELTKDRDRTLAQAIKSHLREVDKRKQAETISAGNLARAEKAEAERDEANDERDDAVARWTRRAKKAEAEWDRLQRALDLSEQAHREVREVCERHGVENALRLSVRLESVCDERDRLREENKSLREANEIDLGEKAPLIFENAELKARNEILREELLGAKVAWDMCDAVNRGLRKELREAEEAILHADKWWQETYHDQQDELDLITGNKIEPCGDGCEACAFEMHPAVRRARERKEKEEQC